MEKVSPSVRFWRFVKDVGPDACWIWQGVKVGAGYGSIKDENRRNIYAHRLSYEMHVGPIPAGLVIDHLCKTISCVNPSHLEAVSQRENVRRGDGRSALIARVGTCLRGHERTPEHLNKRGQCRTCRNMARRTGRPVGRPPRSRQE